MREKTIEAYLVSQVKKLGGEVRKVQFIGHSGAPDRLVMLPWRIADASLCKALGVPKGTQRASCLIWVELKAPGEKAKPHQLREHARLRKWGQSVAVVDSFERVDEVLR